MMHIVTIHKTYIILHLFHSILFLLLLFFLSNVYVCNSLFVLFVVAMWDVELRKKTKKTLHQMYVQ